MAKKQKETKKTTENDAGNEKLCAILSYLLIGIVWYFADDKLRKSEFAKYHVKQGLFLFLFCFSFSFDNSRISHITLFLNWFDVL